MNIKQKHLMDHQKKELKVIINSPNKLIWDGIATSVSSKNSAGSFDILPEHANFITMIQDDPIVVRSMNEKHTFTYENAILSVYRGIVTIYTEI